MPEHYTDQQILDLAEGVFGVDGMRPRHKLRVLLKRHGEHGDHITAPVYLRLQHGVGTHIEMRPSGDRKGVEFTLSIPGNGGNDFALCKDDLKRYNRTQRELISDQLKMLYQNLDKLRSVRIVREPVSV